MGEFDLRIISTFWVPASVFMPRQTEIQKHGPGNHYMETLTAAVCTHFPKTALQHWTKVLGQGIISFSLPLSKQET